MDEFPMTPVTSSNIAAIGFAEGRLRIRFKNGTTYEYDAVPAEAHAALMAADADPERSLGGQFHKVIRNGGYSARRL